MKINNVNKTETLLKYDVEVNKEEYDEALKEAKEIEKKQNDKHGSCGCHDEKCHETKCEDEKCECDKKENHEKTAQIAVEILKGKVIGMIKSSSDFSENNVIEIPSINLIKQDENGCLFEVTFDIKPNVTLPNFDNFKLEKRQEIIVDTKDVEAELQTLLERSKKAVEINEDRTLEKGDIADINFVGKIDGEAFQGGSADNFELTIGSGQFIPGFEDQMIGMKKGETKDVNVQFPKDYQAKELAGKDAVFTVTLNSIKKEVTPELNDSFVKEIGIPNVTNVEELKKYIEKFIYEQKNAEQENKLEKKVFEHLSTSKLSHEPQIMIQGLMKQIEQQQMGHLAQYGVTLDQYLQLVGQDKQKLLEEFKQEAMRQAAISLALDVLIKEHKIDVTDKELEDEIENIAKAYGITPEVVKSQVPEHAMKSSVKTKKIIDKIVADAQEK